MKENYKRIMTVSGALMTALAIALSMLAFLTVTARAATGTGMPSMSEIIPGEDGTSALTLPEGGNVDTNDVVTPNDTTRTPMTILPEPTSRPSVTNTPGAVSSAPDGTDTGMAEDDGGGILGAVIAVIVVVAIILVVIALIPRKKK